MRLRAACWKRRGLARIIACPACRIAPGTAVHVKSDSGEKIYRGQIGFISPRAEFTPKTVETTDLRTDLVYRLRIVIDEADSDAALRQGMPVTIAVDAKPASSTRVGER